MAGGLVFGVCWWGVTGPCWLSPFPTGSSSSPGGCGPRAGQRAAMLGLRDVAARGNRSRILRSDLCFLLHLPGGAARADTRSALNLKKKRH